MFKKGDRVSTTDKRDGSSRVVPGTVVSASASGKITMVADGGKYRYSGHHTVFATCTTPLPKDPPSAMDAWSVKSFKRFRGMSEETEAFVAKICLDGKPVMETRNDGRGGCDMFYPLVTEGFAAIRDRFENDLQAWMKQFSGEEMTEASSFWIPWYVDRRPYGVLASDYLTELKEDMKRMSNPDEPFRLFTP